MNSAINTYAAYSFDDQHKYESSSGGIFFEIAKSVIEKKGVVYGVAMTSDNYGAEYIRVDQLEELRKVLGSKYIQANVNDSFQLAKKDVESGTYVLFSGTPCVINGLKLFLGKEYKNLLCVDIVCHGVPSPYIWEKYVKSLESKYLDKVTKVDFRCKKLGWEKLGLSIASDNYRYQLLLAKDDPYLNMFLKNYILRPACYKCKAKTSRYADITLGDFWGIDNVVPEMNNQKGTSLVIVRSEEGHSLLNSIREKTKIVQVQYDSAIKTNPAEFVSVSKPDERDAFFADSSKMEFDQLRLKYTDKSLKKRIKRMILSSSLGKYFYYFCGGGKNILSWETYGLLFIFENEKGL